jgi:hypothetical protein
MFRVNRPFTLFITFFRSWYADLILRIKELESWTSDFSLPASVWLSGFFNPQSFLTAIMQVPEAGSKKTRKPRPKLGRLSGETFFASYANELA